MTRQALLFRDETISPSCDRAADCFGFNALASTKSIIDDFVKLRADGDRTDPDEYLATMSHIPSSRNDVGPSELPAKAQYNNEVGTSGFGRSLARLKAPQGDLAVQSSRAIAGLRTWTARQRKSGWASMTVAQEWEGYVRTVKNGILYVDLVDITAGAIRANESAEIPLEELSDSDQIKAKVGSVFRWVIGYRRDVAGTKMRASNIVFRDLPQWTRQDASNATSEADEMFNYLNPHVAPE